MSSLHRRLLLFVATLSSTVWFGCPLDIRVRCEDTVCEEAPPPEPTRCTLDANCPAGSRCNEEALCEEGPRLGEPCEGFDCQQLAVCHPLHHRCEYSCRNDAACPNGYRCSPDFLCIAPCNGTPPETVGGTCQFSTDCTGCAFCVPTGSTRVCRQPCQTDADCPGGAPGVCEQVGQPAYRACRVP